MWNVRDHLPWTWKHSYYDLAMWLIMVVMSLLIGLGVLVGYCARIIVEMVSRDSW